MLIEDRQGRTVSVYVSHPIDGGIGHIYPDTFGDRCEVHGQVCDPFRPVSLASVLKYAANDPTLPDGAFVMVSRALRGIDPIDPDIAFPEEKS